MPPARSPFLNRHVTRHGRVVWYFRRGRGARVRLPGDYGSAEFLAAYDAAARGEAPAGARKGPPEGAFAWGLALYRRSQAWAALAPATRRQRENIFQRIEEKLGATPLRDWTREKIAAGRDRRAQKPAAARHFVEALRGLFQWLLEAGIVRADPTQGIRIVKPKSEGFAAWSEADVAAFRQKWPLGTRERLAFEVLIGTGLRRGDAVMVGRPHVRAGIIRIKTEKTKEWVAIAIEAPLAAALEAGPCGELTFIAGDARAPLKKESFGNWFREACNAAGIRKSAHGIRKFAATKDAEDGWSEAELNGKYGWTGHRMSSHYTRTANRERLSLGAAERVRKR